MIAKNQGSTLQKEIFEIIKQYPDTNTILKILKYCSRDVLCFEKNEEFDLVEEKQVYNAFIYSIKQANTLDEYDKKFVVQIESNSKTITVYIETDELQENYLHRLDLKINDNSFDISYAGLVYNYRIKNDSFNCVLRLYNKDYYNNQNLLDINIEEVFIRKETDVDEDFDDEKSRRMLEFFLSDNLIADMVIFNFDMDEVDDAFYQYRNLLKQITELNQPEITLQVVEKILFNKSIKKENKEMLQLCYDFNLLDVNFLDLFGFDLNKLTKNDILAKTSYKK